MRGKYTPSDKKKILKMSLQAKWGPGLDFPKRTRNWWVRNNILWWPPCQGVSVSARTASHPPPKVERRHKTVYRINAEAMRTVRKVRERERERKKGGEDLDKESQAFGSERLKYTDEQFYKMLLKKTKCLMFVPRALLDVFPHATSHTDVHGRAQRPRF